MCARSPRGVPGLLHVPFAAVNTPVGLYDTGVEALELRKQERAANKAKAVKAE